MILAVSLTLPNEKDPYFGKDHTLSQCRCKNAPHGYDSGRDCFPFRKTRSSQSSLNMLLLRNVLGKEARWEVVRLEAFTSPDRWILAIVPRLATIRK
jgi:hypothetical protein